MINLVVGDSSDNQRIDSYLAQLRPELSRAAWQQKIKSGLVTINGAAIKPKYKIQPGDMIAVESSPEAASQQFEIPIIFENSDVIIINKPAGLLTHRVNNNSNEASVVESIRAKLNGFNETSLRPGIVHRLDRDTSGVLVVAKTPEVLTKLQQQFAQRRVTKEYRAVLTGALSEPEATINLPLARSAGQPHTFEVNANGKEAKTRLKLIAEIGDNSLVSLSPTTGRTHQLRVHCAYIGHPIVGDRLYGVKTKQSARLMLHAYKLKFNLDDQTYEYSAKLPRGFGK